MIAVSQKFKDYAVHPRRNVEFKCLINEVEYDKSSIISMDIEDSIVSGQDFELGAVVSSKLALSMRTADVVGNNAEIKPFVRFLVDGDASEWIQQGVMYVDSRSKIGSVHNFSCFDKLITSQKSYQSDLTYPNTQYQVLVELSYNLGIEVDENTLSMINLAYMVDTKPDSAVYTFRDIIRFIAISHGCSVRMNNIGKLEFVSFVDRSAVKTIEIENSRNYRELNPFKQVKKIVFNYDSELEPIIIGEGDEDVTLYTYNPWATVEMAEAVFLAIYDLSYMPSSFDWKCEPWIQTGDFVNVETRNGVESTIVLRLRKKYKGGLKASIESPSVTANQSEFGWPGSTGKQLAQIGQRIGVFARNVTSADKKVRQVPVNVCLLPLTTASETDIEANINLYGTIDEDAIVSISFLLQGMTLGIPWEMPVRAGVNFITMNTLLPRVPKISDWLFLKVSVSSGIFTIPKEKAEFYIYGGNIVSGYVKPILDFEDTVTPIAMPTFGTFYDELVVGKMTPIGAVISDTIANIGTITFGTFSDSLDSVVKTPI